MPMRRDEFVREVHRFCALVSGIDVQDASTSIKTEIRSYQKVNGIMFEVNMPTPALNLTVTREFHALNLCEAASETGCTFFMQDHKLSRFGKSIIAKKLTLIREKIGADIADEAERHSEMRISNGTRLTITDRIESIIGEFACFMTKQEMSDLRISLAGVLRGDNPQSRVSRLNQSAETLKS